MSNMQYKVYIKKKVREASYIKLTQTQLTHKKVKHIIYPNLKSRQEYLSSSMFNNNLISLLFNLRCRSVSEFKDNFHTMYGSNINCPLCLSNTDSQEHGLSCPVIIASLKVEDRQQLETIQYEHIYGNTTEQYNIASIYKVILELRHSLLERGNKHDRLTGASIPDQ